MATDLKNRFWAKVDRRAVDECWGWRSSRGSNGYGLFMLGANRRECAHRTAYRLTFGQIPDGLVIDHLCRNRACVNPAHLEAVTSKENNARASSDEQVKAALILAISAAAAMRRGMSHCKRGHEFTPENTRRTNIGGRRCKKCAALHAREHRRKLREAV